jgi:hypothetical protein
MSEKERGVLGDVNILNFRHAPRHPLEQSRDICPSMPDIAELIR